MDIAEALAKLPENLQEEALNLQNSYGESVALRYDGRKLPRHKRRTKK